MSGCAPLLSPAALDVLGIVATARKEDCTSAGIARQAGRPAASVRRDLRRLEVAGLVKAIGCYSGLWLGVASHAKNLKRESSAPLRYLVTDAGLGVLDGLD